MIPFLLGCVVGGVLGVLVMAIVAAGRCDDDLHQLRERVEGPWEPVVISDGQCRHHRLPREVMG